MATSHTSIVAGLTVAAFGLLPLGLLLVESQPQETDVVVAPTTTTSVVTTIVEVAPPEVEGLDPRLGRVLYASGSAQGIRAGETDELPDPIVKVLGYYDVTLTVEIGDQP